MLCLALILVVIFCCISSLSRRCLFYLFAMLHRWVISLVTPPVTSRHSTKRKPAAGFVPAEWFFCLTVTDGKFAQSASNFCFPVAGVSSAVLSKLCIKWINNINPNGIGYISFGVAAECRHSPHFQTRRRSSSLRKHQMNNEGDNSPPLPHPPFSFLTCPSCCYYSWPLRASGKFPYDEPEASALRWGDFHKAGHSASGWGLWWLTSTSTRVDAVATFPAAPRAKRAADAGVLPPLLRS